MVRPELEKVLSAKLVEEGLCPFVCTGAYTEVFRALVMLEPVMIVAANQPWLGRLTKDISRLGMSTEIVMVSDNADAGSAAGKVMSSLGYILMKRRLRFTELDDYCGELAAAALSELCITPNYIGYGYIREIVVSLMMSDLNSHDALSKSVYPRVAKKYFVSAASVERSIRTAVRSSWGRADSENISKYLGAAFAGRETPPTNKEFLFAVANTLAAEVAHYKRSLREKLFVDGTCVKEAYNG
ncbi:sporulation initiation factor Spo0A C-terminal domain-containing protein [Ruminococcus sp. YE71]|uniref:sporulation initiation factor Spo0A C-terminal domain-containing protein n=2 Tax=unclassified Ruminococcus TaxID=2608920 RepID=UPI0009303A47|nr:sporulation initiation factor Spo0A C-terminal domain-containing protein [Ruminococcus sp. YE71]